MWCIKFIRRYFLLVVFIKVSLATIGKQKQYPWLEQISRQEQLTLGCENLKLSHRKHFNHTQLSHILVDHKHKLLYCYVPKVACTNWKRVFMVLTGYSQVFNLVDIPSSLAHADNSTIKLSQLPKDEAEKILSEYTAFLVVRHPFERVLSAYNNKFGDSLPSSKYFQARYGKQIIKTYRSNPKTSDLESGANVTFREFILYLLNEGLTSNEHWTPIFDLCFPCTINYTFVGHYETLNDDARAILELVKAPKTMFPVTRNGHTREKLRGYLQQLSIYEIQHLYKLYLADFKLFGYGLEEMLGYDLA